jgi:hypothetical protein
MLSLSHVGPIFPAPASRIHEASLGTLRCCGAIGSLSGGLRYGEVDLGRRVMESGGPVFACALPRERTGERAVETRVECGAEGRWKPGCCIALLLYASCAAMTPDADTLSRAAVRTLVAGRSGLVGGLRVAVVAAAASLSRYSGLPSGGMC